jgi:hypothetical protein
MTRTPEEEQFAQRVIRKLELPADADDATILAAVEERTTNIANAEVAEAIRSGKILASHRDYWTDAFKSNFATTRTALASLASPRQALNNLDGSSKTAQVQEIAGQTPSARFDPVVTTLDQMNAAIEADENLHRGAWAIGIRDGLKPPPQQFTVYPDVEPEWDPQPKLVMHEDGTGHWETPEPDEKWLGTQGPRGQSRTGNRTND